MTAEARTPAMSAIERLYRDEHQSIARYLERLVENRETAEDLAHETFIKALRHWDQQRSACPRGWLFRIARNTAYDHLRRRRQLPMLPLDDRSVECAAGAVPAAGSDDADVIWETIRHLPETYRVPLVLQVAGGYAPSDIATLLGWNATTVRTRLHRARAQFRALYVRHA
jgi:RNA polymerase sigma-70 factor, ECF subfamily